MDQPLSFESGPTPSADPPEPAPKPKRKSRARPGSLKAWRTARGVNQRVAAEALGITQAMYARLELEQTYARPKLAQRLSVLTDVALEVLLGLHR